MMFTIYYSRRSVRTDSGTLDGITVVCRIGDACGVSQDEKEKRFKGLNAPLFFTLDI
jgi:hypothetical protein